MMKFLKHFPSFLPSVLRSTFVSHTRNNLNFQSCGFMYGELTDKETVARVEYALEHQQHDQFEILLYKKNSE